MFSLNPLRFCTYTLFGDQFYRWSSARGSAAMYSRRQRNSLRLAKFDLPQIHNSLTN